MDEKIYILVLRISEEDMKWFRNQKDSLFTVANSYLSYLSTGYFNYITLRDNELQTNHKDHNMFINCYRGNPIP